MYRYALFTIVAVAIALCLPAVASAHALSEVFKYDSIAWEVEPEYRKGGGSGRDVGTGRSNVGEATVIPDLRAAVAGDSNKGLEIVRSLLNGSERTDTADANTSVDTVIATANGEADRSGALNVDAARQALERYLNRHRAGKAPVGSRGSV